MPKSLNDAIGCWTTDKGGLPWRGTLVMDSINRCKRGTIKGNAAPEALKGELELLKGRAQSLLDLTEEALKRCQYIIDTKELDR